MFSWIRSHQAGSIVWEWLSSQTLWKCSTPQQVQALPPGLMLHKEMSFTSSMVSQSETLRTHHCTKGTGGSPPPRTPVPKNLIPFSGLCGHLSHTHTHTHTQFKYIFIKRGLWNWCTWYDVGSLTMAFSHLRGGESCSCSVYEAIVYESMNEELGGIPRELLESWRSRF